MTAFQIKPKKTETHIRKHRVEGFFPNLGTAGEWHRLYEKPYKIEAHAIYAAQVAVRKAPAWSRREGYTKEPNYCSKTRITTDTYTLLGTTIQPKEYHA